MSAHFTHTGQQSLKKNQLQPHLKKTWCIGTLDSTFIARMERLLWLYRLPYNRLLPVVCYDERPCFLIGEAVAGLDMKSGQVAREHYAYEKKGSCNLLATIEPLSGKRIAQVTGHRTKREFALHCQEVEKEFPDARKIRMVLDNLNRA